MDWIIGLIDIILIVLVLIALFVGYRTGFMKKTLGLIGIIAIIIFAFSFAGQFADWLTEMKMPPSEYLYNNIYQNVLSRGVDETTEGAVLIEKGLDINPFFATIIYWMLGKPTISGASVAEYVASNVTHLVMTIIGFFMIVVLTLILVGILKLIAKALRENKFVKVVDGLLGMVLYTALLLAGVLVILAIFRIIIELNPNIEETNSFLHWFYVDIKLGNDTFSFAKSLYKHNFIYNFIHLFFPASS